MESAERANGIRAFASGRRVDEEADRARGMGFRRRCVSPLMLALFVGAAALNVAADVDADAPFTAVATDTDDAGDELDAPSSELGRRRRPVSSGIPGWKLMDDDAVSQAAVHYGLPESMKKFAACARICHDQYAQLEKHMESYVGATDGVEWSRAQCACACAGMELNEEERAKVCESEMRQRFGISVGGHSCWACEREPAEQVRALPLFDSCMCHSFDTKEAKEAYNVSTGTCQKRFKGRHEKRSCQGSAATGCRIDEYTCPGFDGISGTVWETPHPPNIAPCETVNPRGCGKPKGRPHLCSNPNWVAVCPHVCSKQCKAAKEHCDAVKNAPNSHSADDRKKCANFVFGTRS